jgi:hypothetical protein
MDRSCKKSLRYCIKHEETNGEFVVERVQPDCRVSAFKIPRFN